MKVLIISSDEIDVTDFNANFDILKWEEVSKRDDINFSDYDGLVLDADSLRTVKNDMPGISFYAFERSLNYIAVCDILGRKGSFVSIIGNPSTVIQNKSIAGCIGFKVEVKNLSGSSIGDYDDDKQFALYWRSISDYKYYIEGISAEDIRRAMVPGCDIELYDGIRTRSGYIIGTCVSVDDFFVEDDKVFEGTLSFIPPLLSGKNDTVRSLLDIFLKNIKQKEPSWAKQLLAVGQDAIDDEITKVDSKIEDFRKKRALLDDKRKKIRQPIEILYKADKELEKSVAVLLENLGFKVVWPEKKNEAEFFIEMDNKKFVIEVKSTKKEVFDKKGLRQVVEWQMDKLSESGEEYKALLITSNQFSKPLDERNKNILPPNLVSFAEKYDICVLPVVALFSISQQIADGKYSPEEFVELMKETKGTMCLPERQK